MIRFDLIQELDGAQLMQELESSGIIVNPHRSPTISEGSLWLDINPADTQKAQDVLNKHIPKPRPEPTIADKLASVGLSIDDLKVALGL